MQIIPVIGSGRLDWLVPVVAVVSGYRLDPIYGVIVGSDEVEASITGVVSFGRLGPGVVSPANIVVESET